MNLKDVTKYHSEWVRIAIYFGADSETSKDIIQNFYIKLSEIEKKEGSLKRLMYKDEPNKSYMFAVIRSQVFKYNDRENKYCRLNGHQQERENEDNEVECKVEFEENLKNVIKNYIGLNIFSKIIFHEYLTTDHSIRSLAKAMHISPKTIQNEIEYVRKNIKEKING